MEPNEEIVEKIKKISKDRGEEISDEEVDKRARSLTDLAEFLVRMFSKRK